MLKATNHEEITEYAHQPQEQGANADKSNNTSNDDFPTAYWFRHDGEDRLVLHVVRQAESTDEDRQQEYEIVG